MRLYLAHPLSMRKDIRTWEKAFEERTGIELFNPFYDDESRNDIRRLDEGKYTARTIKNKQSGEKIVNRDLINIKNSDGLVAIIDVAKSSIGTPMEIFYSSHILKKPTYTIADYKSSGHPWIVGLSTEVFRSPKQFEEFIQNGNNNRSSFI